MVNRCGDTLLFEAPPVIAAGAAVGGKKESEGPLAAEFDELSSDNRFGQSGWEAAWIKDLNRHVPYEGDDCVVERLLQ